MRKIPISLLAILLLLTAFPARSARIDLDDRIAQIPAYITDVSTCGPWQNEQGNYFFRVLHASFYQGNSLLYIQWLRQTGPYPEVIQTVSIPEFNADDHIELTFVKPRCIPTPRGIRLAIVAESGHDSKKRSFQLEVFREPGKYRLRQKGER